MLLRARHRRFFERRVCCVRLRELQLELSAFELMLCAQFVALELELSSMTPRCGFQLALSSTGNFDSDLLLSLSDLQAVLLLH